MPAELTPMTLPSLLLLKVACPPPAGSNQASWTLVTDAVWDDVIVRGKPDNILVCVAPNTKENRQREPRLSGLSLSSFASCDR